MTSFRKTFVHSIGLLRRWWGGSQIVLASMGEFERLVPAQLSWRIE
ncbi:MAG TPA: hypothetical protein VH684_29965 [Xanthobacteraceae bacterium]|jgi:hypothetical protein